jgi:hypothetical protein
LLNIDDAFFKDNDDAECGLGWNTTEGEELLRGLNSSGRFPANWIPSIYQRTMCDDDTRRRIAEFVPWDYSASAATSDDGSAAGFDTEFRGSGDGGALFRSMTTRPLSAAEVGGLRTRLGQFLEAFSRVGGSGEGGPAAGEARPNEAVQRQHLAFRPGAGQRGRAVQQGGEGR